MTDIPVSIQFITPLCRANRSALGALEEAISRVRNAYVAYHDLPDNADVTWRISLVRVDEECSATTDHPAKKQSTKADQ